MKTILVSLLLLSAVYPDTLTLPKDMPVDGMCYVTVPYPETGLNRLETWIKGSGDCWDSLASCWTTVFTRQDSSTCFNQWWPCVKAQAEPRLLTSVSILHMEGMKVIIYPQDWWIKYWVFVTDTAGNRSCPSDTVKVKLIP